MDPARRDAADRALIARARRVSRNMRRLGWASIALGVAALLATLGFLLAGYITIEDAAVFAFGWLFASLLSGGTTYAVGVNLSLGASRLERSLPAAEDG